MQVWAFLCFKSTVIAGFNTIVLRSEIYSINTPLCITFRFYVLEMLKSRTTQSSPRIRRILLSVPLMFGFIIYHFHKIRVM